VHEVKQNYKILIDFSLVQLYIDHLNFEEPK